jgi:hypothetical protein
VTGPSDTQTKQHVIVGSLAAAGATILPVVVMALAAGAALTVAPLLYIAAVPVCCAMGKLLLAMGLKRLGGFMAGSVIVTLLFGMLAGLLLSSPFRYGIPDTLLTTSFTTLFALISGLPAALCWWLFVAAPIRTKP